MARTVGFVPRIVSARAVRQGLVVQASFANRMTRVAQPSGHMHAAQMTEQALNLAPLTTGQPLPAAVRQKMESALGANFADVRVHVGPEAARIGAIAFTTGSDIYFAHGQYNTATPAGQRLLGHELVHVVQQRAGRVRNPFGGGIAVVQDPALEAEADRLGSAATAHAATARAGTAQRSIQRQVIQKMGGDPTELLKIADGYDAKTGDALGLECYNATAKLQVVATAKGLNPEWVGVTVFDTPTEGGGENHYALEIEFQTGRFVLDATYRQFPSAANLSFQPAKTYVGQYDAWKRLMGEIFKGKGVKAMRGSRSAVTKWSDLIAMGNTVFAAATGEIVNQPAGF